MLLPHAIDCPYCGEAVEILIDASIPSQRYIEDCQVCCRPIMLGIRFDAEGDAQVSASAENDA